MATTICTAGSLSLLHSMRPVSGTLAERQAALYGPDTAAKILNLCASAPRPSVARRLLGTR